MINLGKCDDCGKYISDGDSVVHYECYMKLLDKISELEDKVIELETK